MAPGCRAPRCREHEQNKGHLEKIWCAVEEEKGRGPKTMTYHMLPPCSGTPLRLPLTVSCTGFAQKLYSLFIPSFSFEAGHVLLALTLLVGPLGGTEQQCTVDHDQVFKHSTILPVVRTCKNLPNSRSNSILGAVTAVTR